jgi:hypothetical protein
MAEQKYIFKNLNFLFEDSEVNSSHVDDDGQSGVVRGVAIGFAAVAMIAVAVFAFAFYRRTRMNR